MVLTKDDFLRRWNSGPDGGGITNDDCADCYVAWGLGSSPRTMPLFKLVHRVVEAAATFCKDNEMVGMASGQQQETLADILAAMRSEPLYNPHGDPALVEANKVLKNYADRIEAAAKREMDDLKSDADSEERWANQYFEEAQRYRAALEAVMDECCSLCDIPNQLSDSGASCDWHNPYIGCQSKAIAQARTALAPSETPPATYNAAKLRKAVCDLMDEYVHRKCPPEKNCEGCERKCGINDAWLAVSAALAAPPRNCDRFATANDAANAWQAYSVVHRDRDYSLMAAFNWLFAPAEGKEAHNG